VLNNRWQGTAAVSDGGWLGSRNRVRLFRHSTARDLLAKPMAMAMMCVPDSTDL
jgi:hypothetical protein